MGLHCCARRPAITPVGVHIAQRHWRAGYVLLDVGAGEPRVEAVRVEYDVEAAMRAIRASDLPDDFAEYLRAGGKPAPAGAAGR